MSTSLSGEEGTPLPSSPLVPRKPRVGDTVLLDVWRLSIVRLSATDAHLVDGMGWHSDVVADHLRWVADRDAWVVILPDAA